MPTTAWIFISALTAALSYVGLTMAYIFLMPVWVSFANTAVMVEGPTTPGLNTVTGYLTSNINEAFVLLAVGIFIFMYIAPFRQEPTSLSVGDTPLYALDLMASLMTRFQFKKRHGIMAAIGIFVLTVIFIGVLLILLDQVMQPTFSWGSTNYPSGVYDSNVFTFLQQGWLWFGLAAVLIPMSIWLYLRSQEEDQTVGGAY